jgi:hypothetical protein
MERRINWEMMAGPTHSVKDTNELFAVNELVSYRPTILLSSHAHCRTGLTRCDPNVNNTCKQIGGIFFWVAKGAIQLP